MTDELVWQREAPLEMKFYILLGVYAARIIALFFAYLFAKSLALFVIGLFMPLGTANVTFLTNNIYTFDGTQYINVRLVLSLILTLIHSTCATGLRHSRTSIYAKVLIYCELFLLLLAIFIKSIPFILILLLLIIIWGISLYGIYLFRSFCDTFIEEHRIKDPDPYGIFSTPTDEADIDEEVSSDKTYFSSYGNDLIAPIKVNLDELPSMKNIPQDTNDSHQKSYF